MNQLYAITNNDPRVIEGIRILASAGPVTQREEPGPMGPLYITTFWRVGVNPYEINGPDFRALGENDGCEFISGDLTTAIYRRISATVMRMMGMALNYQEPVPPPPPPIDPGPTPSPVGHQISGNRYAYVGSPKYKVGDVFNADPRGSFVMHGTPSSFGIMNAEWEKIEKSA